MSVERCSDTVDVHGDVYRAALERTRHRELKRDSACTVANVILECRAYVQHYRVLCLSRVTPI